MTTTDDERSDVEKLGEWLRPVHRHKGWCPMVDNFPKRSCTCGLTEARELAKGIEEDLQKLNDGFIEVAGWWNTASLDRDEFRSKLSTAEAELGYRAARIGTLRARVEELEGQT